MKKFVFLQSEIGAWCSWLAFLHGVQAVASSSPAAPTFKNGSSFLLPFFSFRSWFVGLQAGFNYSARSLCGHSKRLILCSYSKLDLESPDKDILSIKVIPIIGGFRIESRMTWFLMKMVCSTIQHPIIPDNVMQMGRYGLRDGFARPSKTGFRKIKINSYLCKFNINGNHIHSR